MKPSSKQTSCKFLLNQLTSALLGVTGNLTSTLENTLGNTLRLGALNLGKTKGGSDTVSSKGGGLPNQITSSNKKPNEKSSAQTRPAGGGLLGIF